MSLTTGQGRDAIIGLIETAWEASGAASELVLMLYENTPGDKPGEDASTGKSLPYAKTSIRHRTSPQITQGSARRYLTEGVVTVEIYTPLGDGHTLSDALSAVILSALRGHTGSAGGIWFYDIEPPKEIGPTGGWFQVNVSANFRYQERP